MIKDWKNVTWPESWSPLQQPDESVINGIKSSCLVLMPYAGVMVRVIFLVHSGPHSTNWASFRAYLNIVAGYVDPCMTTVEQSSNGYFQKDNTPRHKVKIVSKHEHDTKFTVLRRPPQLPDSVPFLICQLHTNLQQLCDAIISTWTKIAEEHF